jgi:hypothetical protein
VLRDAILSVPDEKNLCYPILNAPGCYMHPLGMEDSNSYAMRCRSNSSSFMPRAARRSVATRSHTRSRATPVPVGHHPACWSPPAPTPRATPLAAACRTWPNPPAPMPPPVATAVVRCLERENEREEVATEWIRKNRLQQEK